MNRRAGSALPLGTSRADACSAGHFASVTYESAAAHASSISSGSHFPAPYGRRDSGVGGIGSHARPSAAFECSTPPPMRRRDLPVSDRVPPAAAKPPPCSSQHYVRRYSSSIARTSRIFCRPYPSRRRLSPYPRTVDRSRNTWSFTRTWRQKREDVSPENRHPLRSRAFWGVQSHVSVSMQASRDLWRALVPSPRHVPKPVVEAAVAISLERRGWSFCPAKVRKAGGRRRRFDPGEAIRVLREEGVDHPRAGPVYPTTARAACRRTRITMRRAFLREQSTTGACLLHPECFSHDWIDAKQLSGGRERRQIQQTCVAEACTLWKNEATPTGNNLLAA